eukprot:1557837-Pyramimonas_sp.AAC.1
MSSTLPIHFRAGTVAGKVLRSSFCSERNVRGKCLRPRFSFPRLQKEEEQEEKDRSHQYS